MTMRRLSLPEPICIHTGSWIKPPYIVRSYGYCRIWNRVTLLSWCHQQICINHGGPVIFIKLCIQIYFLYWCRVEMVVRRVTKVHIDDKSTLVQVMAWCCQASSHYLSQCCQITWCHMASLGLNELKQQVIIILQRGDHNIHNIHHLKMQWCLNAGSNVLPLVE